MNVWIADMKNDSWSRNSMRHVPSPEVEGGVSTAPEERSEITTTTRAESVTRGTVTDEG